MFGLSRSTEVQRAHELIESLRRELEQERVSHREAHEVATRALEDYRALALRVTDLVERTVPAPRLTGPVVQPMGVTETDAQYAKRLKGVPVKRA